MKERQESISDSLASYNNTYYESNPLSKIVETLRDKGYIVKDPEYKSLDYEKSSRVLLEITNGEDVLINLYRMPSGKYEVTGYPTGPKPKARPKNSFR